MTKQTTVKSTAKKLTIVAGIACASLLFTQPALAEAIQVQTEQLELRNIEQSHLDLLLTVEKIKEKVADANDVYGLIVKEKKAEFDLCQDQLCQITPLEELIEAHKVYAEANLEYVEDVRDIETNQIQHIIDNLQMKSDSHLDSLNQKRDEFFDSYDQVLPKIQALNLRTPEDFHKLSTDKLHNITEVCVQIARNVDVLTTMMQQIDLIDKMRESHERIQKGFHDHANSYDIRAAQLESAALKLSRIKEFLALGDYKNISMMDLNPIASKLSGLSESAAMSFPSNIDTSSHSGQKVPVINTKSDADRFQFDGTLERINSIRNFKRN